MVDTKAPSLEDPGAVSHSYAIPCIARIHEALVGKPKQGLQCNEIFSSRESTAVIVCEKQKMFVFCASYYDIGSVKRHR